MGYVTEERSDTVIRDDDHILNTKTVTLFTTKCCSCGAECGMHCRVVEVRLYVAHNLKVPSVAKTVLCDKCYTENVLPVLKGLLSSV